MKREIQDATAGHRSRGLPYHGDREEMSNGRTR